MTNLYANAMAPLVLAILNESPDGLSEYDLLKALERRGLEWVGLSTEYNLALFQRHFALMHCLYGLQSELRASGGELFISALRIQLLLDSGDSSASTNDLINVDGGNAQLSAYYANWDHCLGMTSANVEALLRGFWNQYHARDDILKAYDTLGVSADTAWDEVEQSYRRLIGLHHPDRGGEGGQFIAVRHAYEILKINHLSLF